jgi:hypothetical protein
MAFNATFNNISVILGRSVLLVEETGVPSLTPLSTIFQLYRCVQFIGGRNQRTRRKSLTCRKSLTKLLTFQDISLTVLEKGDLLIQVTA